MSNNMIRLGNLDMLRALYDFKATYAKTLSFRENDYFILHQTNMKHKNWWQVINEKGEVGFIPSNYMQTVTVCPTFLLQFLDIAIDYVQRNEISSEYLISDKNDIILRLKELKRQTELLPETSQNSIHTDRDLPPLLIRNESGQLEQIRSKVHSNTSGFTQTSKNYVDVIEEPIKPIQKFNTNREILKKSMENIHEEIIREQNSLKKSSEPKIDSTSNSKVSSVITQHSVYDLVESVRINTQLSHEMSQIAVVTVIQGLHELLPASVFPYLSTILSHAQTSLAVDEVQIEQTHDASRLKIIFNELTSCKEDSQQRSWMLHEDEAVIKDYLNELISILSNADASICKHVVSNEDYHVITTLIQYYQMEIRWSIRQLLLHAFGVLCNLDQTIVNIMLNSVLPGELARDMLTNPRNIVKLNYSALLLTMILSMGEPMPVTHFDLLGVHFLNFLLNNIEYPPDTDIDEQIPELFLNLILSYNLQFTSLSDNIVLKGLEERDVAKTFTEKILLLLNREEDPVRVFDHEPAPTHAVIKLFLDLFSTDSTAALFYTNDVKVLIDIIVRNISDLSPGDKRRRQYLELCRRVMRNTNYGEHMHRRDDVLKCFTRIFCEESDQSKQDQCLVKEISNEFAQYFK